MFRCGSYTFNLDRPLVMGIVNLTPDSFSGDGRSGSAQAAIDHAWAQLEAGADMLDLGAESSRPGAIPTPLNEELDRLLPVLEALRDCGKPLSVDTYKPEVMGAALTAGADLINDIYALRQPGALEVVAASDCGICLMHMQGQPLTMQAAPDYQDVVAEVYGFLEERLQVCARAGVARERILVDPGFGFGKTLAHNAELFRQQQRFTTLAPTLIGVSRKSMLGLITGRSVDQRCHASVVAAVMAAQQGATVLRVHDVAATVDGLKVWQALQA